MTEQPNNLRKLREDAGLGIKQLCDKTGINYNSFVKMERGERSITPAFADTLAKFFGVAPGELHDVPVAYRTVPVVTVAKLVKTLMSGADVKSTNEIKIQTNVARPVAVSTRATVTFDKATYKGTALVVIDIDHHAVEGDPVLALMPDGTAAVADFNPHDMTSLGKVVHLIKDFT